MLENTFPPSLGQLIRKTWCSSRITLVMHPLKNLDPDLQKEGYSNTYQGWLSPQEQEQLAGYRVRKRKLEWLGGRICAKAAIRQYQLECGNSQTAIRSYATIENLPSGRPQIVKESQIPNQSRPDITISHSKEYGVAMAASRYCGIDIQYTSDKLHTTQKHFCTKEETQLLANVDAHQDATMRLALLWSSKEAIKKAVSYIEMPGFLDLVLENATPKPEGVQMIFKINHPSLPSSLEVIAGTMSSYAIGACLTGQEIR